MKEAVQICFMCKRHKYSRSWESRIPHNPGAIKQQATNFERIIRSLNYQRNVLSYYLNNRQAMCPFCNELLTNLETENDFKEFEKKLALAASELRESISFRIKH